MSLFTKFRDWAAQQQGFKVYSFDHKVTSMPALSICETGNDESLLHVRVVFTDENTIGGISFHYEVVELGYGGIERECRDDSRICQTVDEFISIVQPYIAKCRESRANLDRDAQISEEITKKTLETAQGLAMKEGISFEMDGGMYVFWTRSNGKRIDFFIDLPPRGHKCSFLSDSVDPFLVNWRFFEAEFVFEGTSVRGRSYGFELFTIQTFSLNESINLMHRYFRAVRSIE